MRYWIAIFTVVLFLGVSIPHVEAQSREQLQADLKNLEDQISQLNNSITQTSAQSASLKRDISLLQQKIAESKLKIQLHDKAITKLSQNINEKNKNIETLDEKLQREKDSLSQILRKNQYLDVYTLLDFGLQSKTLSTFFSDADSFSTLKRALTQSFKEIQTITNELNQVKTQLEDAKDEEQAKKLAQEAEKKAVEINQKDKNTLLKLTKNQEANYKIALAAREKEAAQIRARLFDLRDSAAISFGQAYDFALAASKTTNIRPALILAILMQESSLGANVGACYLRDYTTGAGVSIKTGDTKPRTMSPTRDVPVFTSLMSKVGRDPQKTPVSCWIPMYSKGQPSGWGGAMGPSQFIPSTWVLFENRIKNITGASMADPWSPYHAITATALYLEDLGAVAGNEASERNAACKYYSGRSCASSSAGAGYGNSVMRKLYSMQADIDKLQR
jgi:membrane-bound lytic murein transglycosylase B